MPKIIVPTDFSPTAATALAYATRIAEATGYDLEVVHVHDGYGTGGQLITFRGDMDARAGAQRQLEQFIRFSVPPRPYAGRATAPATDPRLRSREIVGVPPAAVAELSHDAGTALIVMGGIGSGTGQHRPALFGSVTRAVALGGGCPVLIVPTNAKEIRPERAAVAFDEAKYLRSVVEGMEFLRLALKPEVHFVHVMDEDPTREETKELDLLNEVLATGFPNFPVQLDLLPAGRLADKLTAYLADSSIDLLVMGRRKRSLFQRLFIGSEVGPLLTACDKLLLIVPIENQ